MTYHTKTKHLSKFKVGDRVQVFDVTCQDRYRAGIIVSVSLQTADVVMFDNGYKNTYLWKKIKEK